MNDGTLRAGAPALPAGCVGDVTRMVDDAACADMVHSGELHVLATPAMIGFMETAAYELAQSRLPEGLTTVGTEVQVQHLAACPAGVGIKASARLVAQRGRELEFAVRCVSGEVLLGLGTHRRTIVEAARFQARLADMWSPG